MAGILGFILALGLYLVTANAVGGPGGNQKAFEKGRKNAGEFIEFVKGNKPLNVSAGPHRNQPRR